MNKKSSKKCSANESNGYLNHFYDVLLAREEIRGLRIVYVIYGLVLFFLSFIVVFNYDYLIPFLNVRYQFSEGFLSHLEVMYFLFFRIVVGILLLSCGFILIATGIMGQKSSVTKKKNKKFIRR